MSSCFQFCEVWLRKISWTKFFRILFIGKRWISLGSLLPRRTPRGLLGSHLTMIFIPRGWQNCGRVSGKIMISWERPESSKSSTNMLLMPASPTSSQLNANNIISSQTPLCKVLISFLGIILLKCSLIYAEPHQIPLTEFCDIWLLPSDGGLVEPSPRSLMVFTAL